MRHNKNILLSIRDEESKVDLSRQHVIENSRYLACYLLKKHEVLKEYVLENGFSDINQEIEFFKKIKPEIQGKLIFYNKVFRIETACPIGMWQVHKEYFSKELQKIEQLYQYYKINCLFCQYYHSGRTDKDKELFTRGQINIDNGLHSHIFDSDYRFSTYYDYKVSRIIADELFYEYLRGRINNESNKFKNLTDNEQMITWTESKNALIELIYALYASGSVSHGNIGIRQLALIFQVLFRTPLNDIHHAFHRMKTRSGSRTAFLDQLKTALEEYMDKDL